MNEKLSALMDSELAANEVSPLVKALKADAALIQTWHVYHVVGDSLRKLPLLSPGFSADMMTRLGQEPTILAPRYSSRPSPLPARVAMPLAASLAAVSLVGLLSWQILKINREPGLPVIAQASPQLRTAPAAQTVASLTPATVAKLPPRVVFATAASNSYLLAHQEFSPSTGVEGFPAYARALSEAQDSAQ